MIRTVQYSTVQYSTLQLSLKAHFKFLKKYVQNRFRDRGIRSDLLHLILDRLTTWINKNVGKIKTNYEKLRLNVYVKTNILGYPQKMRLQRRLYGIYAVFKLFSYFTKSLNKPVKNRIQDIKLNLNMGFS